MIVGYGPAGPAFPPEDTMATATATRADRDAQLALFIELAAAKLGVDYNSEPELLKIVKRKPANQIASNIARLREMADHTATPAVAEVMTNAELAVALGEAKPAKGGSGNGARRQAAPAAKVSPKMLNYAAALLREVWAADPASGEELVADLVRYEAAHISRMIDNLLTLIPITEGQVRFAKSLFAQKFGDNGAAEFAASLDTMTKQDAKRMLDTMQTLPDYVAPAAPAAADERPARKNGPEIEADGMYRNPETGDIYKVQVAVHGSGKLYAKVLVKLDEPTIKRNKEMHYEFVMARGAVMTLKPEWKMTREDAAEFGHLYGCCCRCGAVLTDEASIERGIGPVCADKF